MPEVNDTEMKKRTELHLLAEMSDYKGVSGSREILDEVDGWEDIGALAITDINSVQVLFGRVSPHFIGKRALCPF